MTSALYLDASALVKRYVSEAGSAEVRDAMAAADGWFMCRVGFVETMRAVGLAAGMRATAAVRREWPSFHAVEVDDELAEHAARLALSDRLRSLDALHLAAALLLPAGDVTVGTWDVRLHAAAARHGLALLPQRL